MAPLEHGRAELALMDDPLPLLNKRAQGTHG